METKNEKELFNQLKQGDKIAFETIFNTYYASLCHYANRMLDDDEKAEEIVQDLFVNLWSKRKSLNVESSLKYYLFRSVRNLCLNQIQHFKIREKYAKNVTENQDLTIQDDDYFIEVDLAKKIAESINSLPEKRRQIFKLSREEGLKYKEIAEKLNLSVKTVEAQMGLALKQLREKLKDYKDYFIGLAIFKISRLFD
ncbi:MAG TPA: RNA polymerase sigma-70 factor [Sunxiuqinia sp.]|nr:RNA polymerase sigma-70 factor [Sunxiuqinia sp.]